MIGELISAAAGLFGGSKNRKAQEAANAQNAALNRENMAMQKAFAQEGIRWKVADAKAAGIHPLYAIGAPNMSYSPTTVGAVPDTSMGNAMANAGQDISRAMNATRTGGERVDAFTKTAQALQLQKSGLENELLASQIAKMKASMNPPIPAIGPLPDVAEKNKQSERPPLQIGGMRISTDPRTSNMKDFEDRYGDEGPASWMIPPMIAWNDYLQTSGSGMQQGGFAARLWEAAKRMHGNPWKYLERRN